MRHELIDMMSHPKGDFFKVFRKCSEDEGRWTLVADYSRLYFDTEEKALCDAAVKIPWLAEARLSALSARRKNIGEQKA